MSRFHKVLVANRGEIACRVIRSAQDAGYETVAVFSEADAAAPHVRLADQSFCIGPAPATESYLVIDKVLEAARISGADAIHPGYGFLSENAVFAQACEAAGITFIGPSSEAIRLMGDKARAKERMEDAGVPCVPGHRWEDQRGGLDAELAEALAGVGFPLLIKAAAGGGGRGMRRVDAAEQLEAALNTARAEAEAAFGDGTLLAERLIEGGRHVEVQVMADEHGTVLHLGERDCSAQRRHQKVIEEAPSPAVDAELRQRMGQAAVDAAAAVDYRGAGTVEFLLAADGSFYFLEMNTRLQVEHPVTELVTGLDLVDLQLRVAGGEPLGLTQEDVVLAGHAIEARLYAEDPDQGFLPQTGEVSVWQPASGAGLRCDDGIRVGQEVSAFYDPMLAKIIASGPDRATALRRLRRALRETVLLGVHHNGAFLDRVLAHQVFADGAVTTDFLEGDFAAEDKGLGQPTAGQWALAAALFLDAAGGGDGWRSNAVGAALTLRLRCADETLSLQVRMDAGPTYSVLVGDQDHQIQLHGVPAVERRLSLDGLCSTLHSIFAEDRLTLHLHALGAAFSFERILPGSEAEAGAADGRLLSPLAGRVSALHVKVGDQVSTGQPLMVLEAMKLETVVSSRCDGVVESISAAVDDQVARRQLLLIVAQPANSG